MRKNIYEVILSKYRENLDEWRIFMYENMSLLMRKNPLLKHNYLTYTPEDIKSEAFLIADDIVLKEGLPDYKKISKLWYLFNRWGGTLYNKVTQYAPESYNIDDVDIKDVTTYMDDEILNWILIKNNIITPLEEKVLEYIRQGRWKYEIARLMKTTYYNVKSIIDTLTLKIERFIKENDINDAS